MGGRPAQGHGSKSGAYAPLLLVYCMHVLSGGVGSASPGVTCISWSGARGGGVSLRVLSGGLVTAGPPPCVWGLRSCALGPSLPLLPDLFLSLPQAPGEGCGGVGGVVRW